MSLLRLSLPLLATLVVGGFLPTKAPAQDYPDHPVTMIVPFAAGGLTDVPARVLAAMLQDRIGQSGHGCVAPAPLQNLAQKYVCHKVVHALVDPEKDKRDQEPRTRILHIDLAP